MDEIRKQIRLIEDSANQLKNLAKDNPGIRKNAEVILTFVYLLKFMTPDTVKEEN